MWCIAVAGVGRRVYAVGEVSGNKLSVVRVAWGPGHMLAPSSEAMLRHAWSCCGLLGKAHRTPCCRGPSGPTHTCPRAHMPRSPFLTTTPPQVNDVLKAKCGSVIRVELIDRQTGETVEDELPGELRLEVGTWVSTMVFFPCKNVCLHARLVSLRVDAGGGCGEREAEARGGGLHESGRLWGRSLCRLEDAQVGAWLDP